jgi:translation initiation factor 2 subunit 3
MVNVGSTNTGARVVSTKKSIAIIQFGNPVCARIGEKVAISRRVDRNFRLIGWGTIESLKTSADK